MENLELRVVKMSVKTMRLAPNSVYAVKVKDGALSLTTNGLLNLHDLHGDRGKGISNIFGRCTQYNTIKSFIHWACKCFYEIQCNSGAVEYDLNQKVNLYKEAMKSVCLIGINEAGELDHILRFLAPVAKVGLDLANSDDPKFYAVYTAFVNWERKLGNKNFYSAKVNKLAVDTIKCLRTNESIVTEYASTNGVEIDKERAKEDAETIAKKVAKLQRERDAIAAQLEAQKNKPKTTQRKTAKATQTA